MIFFKNYKKIIKKTDNFILNLNFTEQFQTISDGNKYDLHILGLFLKE